LAPWQERRAKELLSACFDGDISLTELARECNLSRSHFARAFRQTTGQPPHRWLLDRRMERAKDLLLRSTLTLADIAIACGFADQSHFTRVFSALFATSPGVWRRAQKS
jgi:AraC family transcriptional regulator